VSTLSHEIDRVVVEVPARRHIQSIVVVRSGEVLLERYFRDRRPEDLSTSLSAFIAGYSCSRVLSSTRRRGR